MRYTNPDNWNEIERQYIFEALMPYVPERPIGFFIPDSDDPEKGTLSKSYGDFSKAAEQQVVLTMKRRKVLILSSDELSQDNVFSDVTVAKIVSIKPYQRNEEWYKLLIEDKHPLFAYIPKDITGQECFVDLSTVTTIGKSMLLSRKVQIPGSRMEIVNERLEECIALGVVKRTEEEIAG